jgi:Xaa-Pro aminopeptidase
VEWFIDCRKITPNLVGHLGDQVIIYPLESWEERLGQLGQDRRTVLVDPMTTNVWIVNKLHSTGAIVKQGRDPCLLPKARKNPVELAGNRAAHSRDGVAVCQFLAWLANSALEGSVTEIEAAQQLLAFRAKKERFCGLSFETISAAGPNAAIVHYRVQPATNRQLALGSLYLTDSGAQYLDGTTDVTRTIAIGYPTKEMCHHFTVVLKGHIAIATVRFPKGTTGPQLDSLARLWLWKAGLDFDHGTGHGVGSYLNVHEGPQQISKTPNSISLEPGMILSNEPAYYKAGAYGIRIESLLAVQKSVITDSEQLMLEFETLTLVPIDRNLIAPWLLEQDEVAWIDAYHARVWQIVGPQLVENEKDWLYNATRPIS